MRILESAPRRYERGMRVLTLGRLEAAWERLAARVEPGQRVIDLGCGTGALAVRAARRGARVKAIDIAPEMLEITRAAAAAAGPSAAVEAVEMGVAELDREAPESFDAVLSSLCFSELSEDEQRFTLGEVYRILKPGGLCLLADETRPQGAAARLLYRVMRAPLVALAYIFTQQTTRPVDDLPGKLGRAGLVVESVRAGALGGLAEFVARKPEGRPT
ncbi:MAG: class I SAM-dependent methyltransferase [Deltaproteobacteria bacterium]|nr:class I SAM-dependent methyltransferase [Deltaproteobacteria bacterium]MBW2420229.1 class I SAM-dependent methyltransferase [Deltaproteobacteria bacterium]